MFHEDRKRYNVKWHEFWTQTNLSLKLRPQKLQMDNLGHVTFSFHINISRVKAVIMASSSTGLWEKRSSSK